MPRFFIIVLLTFSGLRGLPQHTLLEVKGLPTKEVYDLLIDKKGFLWVGHDMGVSRYDGVSFTHFAHPQRSSLSITDLVEDRFGRVWFHNFTGQIFYVEHDQIHLLDAYRNEVEDYFPRMVICGDELVVTSRFGLFICDTKTMKGRYVKSETAKSSSTKSLAHIGNKVLAIGPDHWFLYSEKEGFTEAGASNLSQPLLKDKNFILLPLSVKDTGLMIVNPSGVVAKISPTDGKVKIRTTLLANSFINNITQDGSTLWLHQKTESRTLNGRADVIKGHNVSDVVTDKQGNRWVSSLDRGLLLEQPQSGISKYEFSFLQAGDKVLSFTTHGNRLIIGTQNGNLFVTDVQSQKIIWKHQVHQKLGSINLVSTLDQQNVLVSTSSGPFLFNPTINTFKPIALFIVKEAAVFGNRIFASSSAGLYSIPYNCGENSPFSYHDVDLKQWYQQFLLTHQQKGTGVSCNDLFYVKRRCRSVAYSNSTKEVYASFMDGVYFMGKNEPRPLVLDGEKVYSNSLVSDKDKIFVGTFNKGLLIKSGDNFKKISTEEGLFSNSIVKMQKEGKYLWIFQDRAIQLLDPDSETLIKGIELPQESGANVHDVVVFGDTALLSTNNGIYQILLRPSPVYKVLKSYLQAMLISNSGEVSLAPTELKHFQNNLQFNLSIPYYSPSNSVYFKYRLKGGIDNDQWYATQQGERIVHFASLTPGTYTFEAIAVVGGSQEGTPVSFSFTISKPWWRSTAFFAGCIIIVTLLFYGIYRYRVRQLLKIEQVRRTISTDLHDEIGSTLSSINIYSAMARTDSANKEYLDLIQENTRDVISKLDDLVWSINPKNDTVVQLVSRMRSFAEPLLKGAGIQCNFEVNEFLLLQELPLVTKRNLFLIFKELVNNVVKHSKAKTCSINLDWSNSQISLLVQDDGIGIDMQQQPKERHGMQNLVSRTRSMKAFIYFQENGGPGTSVRVMVPVKLT